MGAQRSYPVAVLGPFHPYRGGIAHHTTLLARTLAESHPVLGVNFTRLYPGFLFPGRTQYDASGAALHAEGVQVVRLLDSIGPHTWWRTAGAIRSSGARLLVLQWWHPFFAPAYASVARLVRRAGVRVVALCHNVLPHEASRLDGALVRLGLGAADAFIVQSETDREAIARLLPERPCRLTPHPAYTFFAAGATGRDAARRQLGLDGNVVLFFGLVRAYKGLDVLLRALALGRQRVPMHLVVAGEFYQDRAPYEALLDELDIRAAVTLTDRYIPNEDVEAYFKACDVVVLPYRSATQSGIVQIAFSFQRPVVVTAVGGLPEAVRPGETGLVVPAADAAALAAALVQFFSTDLAATMRPHLQHAAAAFSWGAMGAAVHDVAVRLGLPPA
jgi:glycosyltransferase involved in cell wall biosynthesis